MIREAEIQASPKPAGFYQFIVMDTVGKRIIGAEVVVDREPGFSAVWGYEIPVPSLFAQAFAAEKDTINVPTPGSIEVIAPSSLGNNARDAMNNDVAVKMFARSVATPSLMRAIWLKLSKSIEVVVVSITFDDGSMIEVEVVNAFDSGPTARITVAKDANGNSISGGVVGGGSIGSTDFFILTSVRPMGTTHMSGWWFCGPDGNGGEYCYPIPAPKDQE